MVAWLLSPEKRGEEVEVRRKEGGGVIFATAGFKAVVVVVVMVVVVVKGVSGSRAWKASTPGRGRMRSSRDGAIVARRRS
jgi:predicted metalloprotease